MGIHRIMPALPVLLLASLALEVSGHGGMVWPPIWQDGHYTSLNKITGYKIYSDPKVKDPNTGLSIADARAWLTDQAYIGGHGDNFKKTGEQTNFKDCGSTCSTWSYGASALEIDFPQAKNTEWARGSDQWVGWIAKGGHWGGYTYRLCKLPEEG